MSGGNIYSPTRLCSMQRDDLNLLFESSRTLPFTNALSHYMCCCLEFGCANWLLLSPQRSLYCRRRILKVAKGCYGWKRWVQVTNIRDDEQTNIFQKRVTRLKTAVLLLHCYLATAKATLRGLLDHKNEGPTRHWSMETIYRTAQR